MFEKLGPNGPEHLGSLPCGKLDVPSEASLTPHLWGTIQWIAS